jgi:hypothetical protein
MHMIDWSEIMEFIFGVLGCIGIGAVVITGMVGSVHKALIQNANDGLEVASRTAEAYKAEVTLLQSDLSKYRQVQEVCFKEIYELRKVVDTNAKMQQIHEGEIKRQSSIIALMLPVLESVNPDLKYRVDLLLKELEEYRTSEYGRYQVWSHAKESMDEYLEGVGVSALIHPGRYGTDTHTTTDPQHHSKQPD